MIPIKQWEAFTPARRKEKLLSGAYTFIPSNSHGLKEGYYLDSDIVLMLRHRKEERSIVDFILDMLE